MLFHEIQFLAPGIKRLMEGLIFLLLGAEIVKKYGKLPDRTSKNTMLTIFGMVLLTIGVVYLLGTMVYMKP